MKQLPQAVEEEVPPGVVVADAGYGMDSRFRMGITELRLPYVLGVQSSTTVWEPKTGPLPRLPRKRLGRPPRLLRRDKDHQPVAVKQLAFSLPAESWKTRNWRQGIKHSLRSRLAAVRVCPAHRDYEQAEPHAEEWLLLNGQREKRSRPSTGSLHCRPKQIKGSGGARQTALDQRT